MRRIRSIPPSIALTECSTAGARIKDFENFHKFSSIVIAWLGLGPLVDIAISTALVRHLRKIQTGFSDTDDMLSKITRSKRLPNSTVSPQMLI